MDRHRLAAAPQSSAKKAFARVELTSIPSCLIKSDGKKLTLFKSDSVLARAFPFKVKMDDIHREV